MSSAEYFDDRHAINAHMDDSLKVDVSIAAREHNEIKACFKKAGIEVVQVPAPVNCQDGVYTANWGLVRGDKVIMSNLPNTRQPEENYAKEKLEELGFNCIKLPIDVHFSGQGDALPCGDYLFTGTTYRTSPEAHGLIVSELGFRVISLQTMPHLDINGNPVINPVTGWPDSFFYDIDLAIAVISPSMIAWCPEAFTEESQSKINALTDLDKIEVSLEEAMRGFACNLVSTGESVIMSNNAPELKSQLVARGLTVYTPNVKELSKGGGFIRCVSLTLNN